MNWAPPDTPPSEARADGTPPAGSAPNGETDAERRRSSAVPAAAWIALLGASLLLTAAIAVVASNWSTIGMGARVAGLTAATAGLLAASQRLRSKVPTSASIIAHVGTYLTAAVGIAASSLLGTTWPGCLVVGGGVLIVATEWQAGRWRRLTMHVAQVAGWALAATGIATLLGTTAGLVAMLASVVLLVAGAQRRSVSLAVLAVLSPALTALADAGIGDGTLLRAGLVGERLGWSGPAVGLIAATVVGAVARHRRNNPLMLVAAASPVVGVVTGLAAADGSSVAWWSVPALVVIASELGVWLLPTERFRSEIDEVVNVLAVTLAGGAWFAPAIATFDVSSTDLPFPWALPITMTAVAVALSLLRWKSAGSSLSDLGVAALAAASIGLTAAFGAPELLVASVAVAATIGASVASRRLSPAAIHPTAWWAVLAIASLGGEGTAATTATGIALLAVLVGVVTMARARLAADAGLPGRLEMTAVVAGASLGAIGLVGGVASTTGLVTAAIVVGVVVLIERRLSVWGIVCTSVAAVIALDGATATGTLTDTYWCGLATAAVVFGIVWFVHRTAPAAAAAASAAVFAVAATAAPAGIPTTDVVTMAMLAVTALTGLAYVFDRHPALDTAALTAGVVLLMTTTFDVDPGWISAAWFVIGLQILTIGWSFGIATVRWCGLATIVGALVSWWFTSGLHEWFVVAIEPADIRAGDLWLGGLSCAALAAGAVLRSSLAVNSWVAYGASLTISGLWLTSVQVERAPVWAVPLLLTIAVTSAGLGAWHRLAAPLVGGTALAIVGVFLATGSDLTAVPTWVWLALGGGALLGTAVLIERSGQPGAPDLRSLVTRWR